jgi:hypothetical protein
MQAFYEDYKRYCIQHEGFFDNMACKNTFALAFDKQKKVKFLGCKGSFHTCEICNNAIDLQSDPSKHKLSYLSIMLKIE